MKSRIASIGCVLLVIVVFASVRGFAQPKGDTVTVKGEVVDLWCYLEGGDHGAAHKQCAIDCATAGNPIGLLTDKGDIYVMMGIKDHQPGKEVLIDKMADTVTVEGTLVKKGGIQAIYVNSVK
jgi:hypothetical protein